nr:pyridoxamine 5'-phosphate oxidase [uncultured Sphingomonas sp.]
MADDLFTIFENWLDEARAHEPDVFDAMSVATVDAQGRPSVRIVLLKDHGPNGFTFYTNADSRKGVELAANPNVALLFHWKSLRRQVRIEGEVHQVSDRDADAYFATRSRDSQLGAHASLQSRPLDQRATFEQQFLDAKARFDGQDVPRPERWVGYTVVPERVEFWEDRPYRLHHRRMFTRTADGWDEGLLYP